MRKRIVCKCGADVTTNVLARHLASPKCPLPTEQKGQLIDLMKIKEKNKVAWLISEGTDSIADPFWYLSIWDGKTNISDWSFVSPRPKHMPTPSSIKKYSETRKGAQNPACRKKTFNFTKEDVQKAAKELFEYVKMNVNVPASYVEKELSKKYVDWRFLFADFDYHTAEIRGDNKVNQLVSYLLEIPVEEYIQFKVLRRGFFIQNGQLSSEHFLQIASKIGSQLNSRVRTSIAQLILYEIIRQLDPSAILEFSTKIGSKWRVFDIYSPKINSFIEMHGRVFHDISKTKPKLIEMVLRNIENDRFKKEFADSQQINYVVFWDDETPSWEEKIKNMFNVNELPEGATYEQCKNKVLSDKKSSSCL